MVGEILKKRREESGKDLSEIAKTLKIKYDYLKAIEDEAFEKLPAEVYVKGYIREYAELLNIDPETAIMSYIQQISPPQDEKNEVTERKVIQRKRLKIGYLLIPLLVTTITFILLIFSREKPETLPPTVETKKEGILKAENSPHVLEVFATDTTWLSVTIDKTRSKEILLKPGESVKWQAKNGFLLKIGNAGGARLVFDRKEINKLGEKGQVIKLNLP